MKWFIYRRGEYFERNKSMIQETPILELQPNTNENRSEFVQDMRGPN